MDEDVGLRLGPDVAAVDAVDEALKHRGKSDMDKDDIGPGRGAP